MTKKEFDKLVFPCDCVVKDGSSSFNGQHFIALHKGSDCPKKQIHDTHEAFNETSIHVGSRLMDCLWFFNYRHLNYRTIRDDRF